MAEEKRDDWYPSTRAKRREMYANILAKIDNYVGVIDGLNPTLVDRIKLACNMYITPYDGVGQWDATMENAHKWEQELQYGDAEKPVQPSPVFKELMLPNGAKNGYVGQFRDDIGLLKKLEGYTLAIGADLMVLPVKSEKPKPDSMQPDFTYAVLSNYRLSAKGRMRGMAAAKFYYRRKGENDWLFVGFVTHLPGEIHVPPAAPGEPETGEIKAIFVENNQEVGQFSTNTEVTLF